MLSGVRVRVVKCHACGGPKQLPSPTAYVYCDFCGALSDWDFSMACSKGNALPGPAYEALHRQLAPTIKMAAARGDRATVKAQYMYLFDRHIGLCPSSYSPRIVDPEFRARYLDYYTDTMTVHDTDPRVVAWTQYMNQRIAELRQSQMRQMAVVSFGLFAVALGGVQQQQPMFPDHLFWAVYQAFRNQMATQMQAVSEVGALAKYPDEVTVQLLERVAVSAFVQGWLPYISANCQHHLIQDAGLTDQYIEAQPPALQLRRCGGCGGQLDVVTGAKCVICFRCGKKVDVTHEFPCPGCGAPSSVPKGSTAHPCPYCGVQIQGTTAPTG